LGRGELVPVLQFGGVDRLQQARFLPTRELVIAGPHHVRLEPGAHLGEGLVFVGVDGRLGRLAPSLTILGQERRIDVVLPLKQHGRIIRCRLRAVLERNVRCESEREQAQEDAPAKPPKPPHRGLLTPENRGDHAGFGPACNCLFIDIISGFPLSFGGPVQL
jgi:hypothetical protein